MGGIAEVLANEGYQISGSDIATNAVTQRLSALGATIFIGHEASHVAGASVVVVSTAIKSDNAEVKWPRVNSGSRWYVAPRCCRG